MMRDGINKTIDIDNANKIYELNFLFNLYLNYF